MHCFEGKRLYLVVFNRASLLKSHRFTRSGAICASSVVQTSSVSFALQCFGVCPFPLDWLVAFGVFKWNRDTRMHFTSFCSILVHILKKKLRENGWFVRARS